MARGQPIICDDTGEVCVTYRDYLHSRHWQGVKERFRASKLHKGKCHVCNSPEKIHLHHKSYKRIGHERLNDLVELCEKCHAELHRRLRAGLGGKRLNKWNAPRRMRKERKKQERRALRAASPKQAKPKPPPEPKPKQHYQRRVPKFTKAPPRPRVKRQSPKVYGPPTFVPLYCPGCQRSTDATLQGEYRVCPKCGTVIRKAANGW